MENETKFWVNLSRLYGSNSFCFKYWTQLFRQQIKSPAFITEAIAAPNNERHANILLLKVLAAFEWFPFHNVSTFLIFLAYGTFNSTELLNRH